MRRWALIFAIALHSIGYTSPTSEDESDPGEGRKWIQVSLGDGAAPVDAAAGEKDSLIPQTQAPSGKEEPIIGESTRCKPGPWIVAVAIPAVAALGAGGYFLWFYLH